MVLLLSSLVILAGFLHTRGSAAIEAAEQRSLALPGQRPGGIFDLSGYVQVPYEAGLNPSGGQITIEARVKRNSTSISETIIGNGWQTSYWLGFTQDGYLRFTPNGNGGLVDSNSVILSGGWHHIAVTYDGTTRRYYINGVLDKTSTSKPGNISPASPGQFL